MYRFVDDSRLRGADPSAENEPDFFFSGELGLMVNKTEKHAIGGTFYFGISSDLWRTGLKARYRYWLTKESYLDVSPGVLLFGDASTSAVNMPGFTAHIALGASDWIALVGQVEVVPRIYDADYAGAPTGQRWTDVSWYGGVKLGSYPGVVGAAVGGLVGLLLSGGIAFE